jgi:hypothetical protein
MIMHEREAAVSALAVNGADVLVLAKTLFATAGAGSMELLEAVANVALNRFLYERDISARASLVGVLVGGSVFPCWRDPRSMDSVGPECEGFGVCLRMARRALSGHLADNTFSAIRFHKRGELPLWATGLVESAAIGGCLFYNNCD